MSILYARGWNNTHTRSNGDHMNLVLGFAVDVLDVRRQGIESQLPQHDERAAEGHRIQIEPNIPRIIQPLLIHSDNGRT